MLDNEGAEIDYNSLTVVELKSIAENKGIVINSTMKKADIIKAILESEI
ncbi:Rho termination factor N-terminal domain-containing protein [Clostridium tertium]